MGTPAIATTPIAAAAASAREARAMNVRTLAL
jgi:hypothetical protein